MLDCVVFGVIVPRYMAGPAPKNGPERKETADGEGMKCIRLDLTPLDVRLAVRRSQTFRTISRLSVIG